MVFCSSTPVTGSARRPADAVAAAIAAQLAVGLPVRMGIAMEFPRTSRFLPSPANMRRRETPAQTPFPVTRRRQKNASGAI